MQSSHLTIPAYTEESRKCNKRNLLRARKMKISVIFSTENLFCENSDTVTFAYDLMVATRNETITVAENISKIEMNRFTAWCKNNKINSMKTKLGL